MTQSAHYMTKILECIIIVSCVFLFLTKAQEEAAAQIQQMFSFISKEEETYTETGLCHVLLVTHPSMLEKY